MRKSLPQDIVEDIVDPKSLHEFKGNYIKIRKTMMTNLQWNAMLVLLWCRRLQLQGFFYLLELSGCLGKYLSLCLVLTVLPTHLLLAVIKVLHWMGFGQRCFVYSYVADEVILPSFLLVYNDEDGDLNPPSRTKCLSENIQVSKWH